MNLLVLYILFWLVYTAGGAVEVPFTADSPDVEKVPQKQIITRGLREVTELPDSTVLRKLQVGIEEEIPEDGATIWGELTYSVFPQDRRSRNRLKGRCFEGMGLSSCRAMNLNTDKKKDRALPYYNHMSERVNQKYCLQCCGENHEDRDGNDMTEMRPGTSQNDVYVWDMDCEVALDQLQMFNLVGQAYGREYRLATQKEGPAYEAEDDFIVCPIVRSICDYERIGPRDFEGNPTCPEKDSIPPGEETFLAGYEMRIDVVER
jgi:hypothetical protein